MEQFKAIVDAITMYGAPRNQSDADFSSDNTYLVSAYILDPNVKDEDDDQSGYNTQIDLFFGVDWEKLQLVLSDATLPLTPTTPGWTNVDEWLIGPDNELCLVRDKDSGACFLAEEE